MPIAAASCLQTLDETEEIKGRVAVTTDSTFTGFDAYKSVIDSDVDVVLLATPPHFRPAQFAYAIEHGKHCFVEKPVAVDVPGALSVQKTAEEAKRKNLAVVSGLCWRYDLGVRETMQRIQDGAIGDVLAIESRYNSGTLWHRGREPEWSEMEYQIRNWLYFTWLSGDHITEQAIHSLDKTGWLIGDTAPKQVMGIGGRQQRTDKKYGNIFDHHVVFYEYPNDVRVFFTCRQQDNCTSFVDENVIGTKGTARILTNTIKGEKKWKYRGPKPSMYRVEHEELFKSIRNGSPINNGAYMTNSTLLAIMGRMGTYTGQDIRWEDVMSSTEKLGPSKYEWADAPHRNGSYSGHGAGCMIEYFLDPFPFTCQRSVLMDCVIASQKMLLGLLLSWGLVCGHAQGEVLGVESQPDPSSVVYTRATGKHGALPTSDPRHQRFI